jgi:hypothetical protein
VRRGYFGGAEVTVADLFQELEEELRADRAMEIWTKYRHWIVGAAVLILVLVAGYSLWQTYAARQAAREGMTYGAALAQLKTDKAAGQAALQQIASGKGPYAPLARFSLAGSRLEANDAAGARALLDSITQGADSAAAGLARIEAAHIAIDTKEYGVADKYLAPLLEAGNPYRALALEAQFLSSWQQGDRAKAKNWLQQLDAEAAGPGAPQGLRARLDILKARFGS